MLLIILFTNTTLYSYSFFYPYHVVFFLPIQPVKIVGQELGACRFFLCVFATQTRKSFLLVSTSYLLLFLYQTTDSAAKTRVLFSYRIDYFSQVCQKSSKVREVYNNFHIFFLKCQRGFKFWTKGRRLLFTFFWSKNAFQMPPCLKHLCWILSKVMAQ